MWPKPLEFLLRLAAASVLVLGLCRLYGHEILRPMLPVIERVVPLLDDGFTLQSVELVPERSGDVVRVRANLSRPIEVGGRVLQPFGTGSMPAGGLQVSLTAGGLLQYGQLLLIVVLAWPACGAREHLLRWLVAVPLLAVLLLADGPPTVVAELQGGVHDMLETGHVPPFMVYSRFLMGGGGAVLGLLLGGLAVVLARVSPWCRRAGPDRSTSALRLPS